MKRLIELLIGQKNHSIYSQSPPTLNEYEQWTEENQRVLATFLKTGTGKRLMGNLLQHSNLLAQDATQPQATAHTAGAAFGWRSCTFTLFQFANHNPEPVKESSTQLSPDDSKPSQEDTFISLSERLSP